MENLKIRVNSEDESKEAQGLLEKLGFKKFVWGTYSGYFIFANSNYYSRDDISNFSECDYKEITLPELRDLVVLNRNNVGDATHTDPNEKESLYFRLFGDWWNLFTGGEWQQFCHMDSPRAAKLKPIEKKEMKEYLVELNEVYILVENDRKPESHWIEIPEGSETFNYYDGKDNLFFLKGIGKDTMFSNDLNDWDWKKWGDIDFDGVVCLWSRHTQPEELPFIDDESKEYLREDANGSYILELTCKQEATEPHAKHWIEVPVGVNFYYLFASGDKVFTKEHSSLGRLLWQRKPPFSINDQYAEIEKVRQTLNQRQEQYGSFEDVAMITEQMVDVMRKGYYENLAYNQKMALYMICSKMARIVNGNPNHKDSWHDIAGYATLIDNELVSEKDMPF